MMRKWTAESVARAPWFEGLRAQIQAELDRLAAGREDRRPALEEELRVLRQRIQGWTLSLADPALSPAVRKTLQDNLEGALAEQTGAEARLRQAEAEQGQARRVVTAEEVADRLSRLADILAADDPTRANIELALHIEAVRGFQDGRVIVRTCKLGALAGDWAFAEAGGEPSSGLGEKGPASPYPGKPRRLARRRLSGEDADSAELREEAESVCEADRFAVLGPEWFWEDEFTLPGRREGWASTNAPAVARKRRETGWTHARLAAHFGKSLPTIRAALKRAAEKDPSTG
jgi:hypothetical protein